MDDKETKRAMSGHLGSLESEMEQNKRRAESTSISVSCCACPNPPSKHCWQLAKLNICTARPCEYACSNNVSVEQQCAALEREQSEVTTLTVYESHRHIAFTLVLPTRVRGSLPRICLDGQ